MKPLNRKQREHLAALSRRFEYVTQSAPDRPTHPDYVPGEAQALAWVISVLGGAEAPAEVRLEMLERRMRSVESRVGRHDALLAEDDDDTGEV